MPSEIELFNEISASLNKHIVNPHEWNFIKLKFNRL